MKVIIVGGVAGGATCATRLRRLSEETEIVLIEKSGYVSFANCGLPYYLGNVIKDRNELTVQTKEGLHQRYNIDVKTNHEVVSINESDKTVIIKNLLSGEMFEEKYDKLVLSTGAIANRPEIPGIHSKKIFTIKNIEDTYAIDDFIKENNPKTVSVIGGGFIGLEMMENLKKRGLKVNLVERINQVMTPIDFDMASFVHEHIRLNNINLLLNKAIKSFKEENNIVIEFEDGSTLESDFIILAIGVTPASHLIANTSIKQGIKGSIVVDKHMKTSNKDIYAIGDVVEINNFITSEKTLISLAGIANKQGRIAANDIMGIEDSFIGGIGTSILKVFDLTVASVGLNENTLKRLNINYDYVVLTASSHATYYPNASSMILKVLFEKNTYKILGGQIIGTGGIDKRIDVLATSILGGFKAYQLKDLDLSYAPPFSSAKDPINMAGFIIDNLKNQIVRQAKIEDVVKADRNVILLDVRTEKEFDYGKLDSFINIPLDNLRNQLSQLDKSKKIYVLCHSGLRSYLACRILQNNGFDCYNIVGGYSYVNGVLTEQKRQETERNIVYTK